MKLTKSEEEVWSRVAQKLLESIIKKALTFNQSMVHLNELNKQTSSSSIFMDSQNSIQSGFGNQGRLLFADIKDIQKVVSGYNIHHNCTHVNKHGVVIDTQGKLL